MYCWGSCSNGELGLGGIEDEHVLIPRQLEFEKASSIAEISCGVNHTLLVIDDGSVYSCGLNNFGQLGRSKGCTRFEKIDSLSNQVIKHVSCGFSHSLALNEWGQIFVWGENSHGQLGIPCQTDDEYFVSTPKMVKSLATLQVIQIAAGYKHSLALTASGDIYSWGSNHNKQLGTGSSSAFESKPSVISSLCGLPIAEISAGGYHSFALTISGSVFGWGKNNINQLGVEDKNDHTHPVRLKFLKSQKIRKISCGEEHTVALTLDGRIFAWGAGTCGQLGLKPSHSNYLPRQVTELMGTSISQIACGRRHTLAYAPDSGRLYAFGLGASGQLGVNARNNRFNPVVVQGSWMPFKADAKLTENLAMIRNIFSGGAQSFALVSRGKDNIPPVDMRLSNANHRLPCLTMGTVDQFALLSETDSIPLDIISLLETVFSSSSCLNCSYLVGNHFICTSKNHGINLALAKEEFFKIKNNVKNPRIIELIGDCLENVLKDLPSSPPDIEALRLYLLLPICHMFMMPDKYLSSLILPFVNAVNSLKAEAVKVLRSWWSVFGVTNFKNVVQIFKNATIFILKMPSDKNHEVHTRRQWVFQVLQVLRILHQVSEDNGSIISYEKFYMPEITEEVNVQSDYVQWRLQKHRQAAHEFYFCDFAFVFDPPAKAVLLQTDAALQMQMAMDEAHFRNVHNFLMPINPENPYLVLHVNRENIVHDTLNQLDRLGDANLKKPLKIMFHGEEAIDQGGVRKEFFLLLLKELLDPKFGMFTSYSETYNIWFSESTYEEDVIFYLVGIVCGLAIYNFTIIALPFPLVLYKKLLNRSTKLEDLNGLSPELVRSLCSLLDYSSDDFEEVFSLTFEISREIYGRFVCHELKPNGSSIPVTQSNKKEYVDLYVDFLLNESVKKQYTAFHRGFHRVCGGQIIELFQPEELMEMVIGNENYDWKELEANAEYKEPYSPQHHVIKMFWKVFHSLDEEQKKKFLLFLTGSDRIPILGIKAVKIVVQPMNVGHGFLPVAHTCFNVLDLPPYETEEMMQTKLLQAIQHTQGFGLV